MQSIYAGAKVNLALNVEGRAGGMHLLSGIYVSCKLADKIILTARKDGEITVRYVGREGIYENDRTVFMAKLMQRRYGTPGVDIVVEKNIPEKGGLGGSSADAAGVARAIAAEFDLGTVPPELLLEAGSDVPFQYVGGSAVVGGKGERMTAVPLPRLYLALLCPPRGVSTAECFSLYDRIGGKNVDIGATVEGLTAKEKVTFGNALERAACALVSEIGEGRKILENAGFSCGMTGSGSTLFGAEYAEDIFREKLKKVVLPKGFRLISTSTEVII